MMFIDKDNKWTNLSLPSATLQVINRLKDSKFVYSKSLQEQIKNRKN